jgi:hypothetical protein
MIRADWYPWHPVDPSFTEQLRDHFLGYVCAPWHRWIDRRLTQLDYDLDDGEYEPTLPVLRVWIPQLYARRYRTVVAKNQDPIGLYADAQSANVGGVL